MRHANALPAENGQHDQARELSLKGERQASETAMKLIDIKFDLILVSPAVRAIETVNIVAPKQATEIINEFYPEGKAIDTMFGELKYAPLQEYFKHELNKVIHEIGRNSAKIVRKRIADSSIGKNDFTVLLGGHAIVLNTTAYYLCNNSVNKATTKNASLDEAGFLKLVEEI